MRTVGALAFLALAGLLIWAVQSVPATASRATVGPIRVAKTIVVYPGLDVLRPMPPSEKPALTANQAFTQYARDNGVRNVTHSLVPVTIYLGLLSVGNGKYFRLRNELAYAFVSRRICIQSIPAGTSPAPPHPCLVWNFIDANTGHMIDELQVPVSGS